jgi:hypothetical protein
VTSILTELVVALPGSVRESNGGGLEWIDWVGEDDQSRVQIWWSDVHVSPIAGRPRTTASEGPRFEVKSSSHAVGGPTAGDR